MSDDGKPSRDQANNQADKPQRSDDDNPFIAFRRFADEQVHSIFNSIVGLPLAQHWNDERIKEWKAWVTEAKGQYSQQAAIENSSQDQQSCRKMESPDREDKPTVVETEDGGKTWSWSWSWSWPPKDGSKPDVSNDLDATQRKAVEEARENAEKEWRQLEAKLKSWWQSEVSEETKKEAKSWWQSEVSEEEKKEIKELVTAVKSTLVEATKDTETEPKHGLFLPWPRSSQQKSNPEREDGNSDEDHSKGPRERLWGRHNGPCRSREPENQSVTTALLGHHGFPPLMLLHGPRFGPLRSDHCRMRWLLSHPYSPVVLEAERMETNSPGPNFVDAFEDLLRVDQGLPLDESWAWERDMWPRGMRLMSLLHNPHPKTQEFWMNMHEGGDWHVPKTGLKPAQEAARSLPRAVQSEQTPQKSSAEHDQEYERFLGNSSAEPKTELDAYEQLLLGSPSPSPPATKHPRPSPPEKPTLDAIAASPILSTVTTTERTVLPDGTVTTKIVLRKRFADGREESSETVNTTRGDAAAAAAPPSAPEQSAQKESDRSGWFWSK